MVSKHDFSNTISIIDRGTGQIVWVVKNVIKLDLDCWDKKDFEMELSKNDVMKESTANPGQLEYRIQPGMMFIINIRDEEMTTMYDNGGLITSITFNPEDDIYTLKGVSLFGILDYFFYYARQNEEEVIYGTDPLLSNVSTLWMAVGGRGQRWSSCVDVVIGGDSQVTTGTDKNGNNIVISMKTLGEIFNEIHNGTGSGVIRTRLENNDYINIAGYWTRFPNGRYDLKLDIGTIPQTPPDDMFFSINDLGVSYRETKAINSFPQFGLLITSKNDVETRTKRSYATGNVMRLPEEGQWQPSYPDSISDSRGLDFSCVKVDNIETLYQLTNYKQNIEIINESGSVDYNFNYLDKVTGVDYKNQRYFSLQVIGKIIRIENNEVSLDYTFRKI